MGNSPSTRLPHATASNRFTSSIAAKISVRQNNNVEHSQSTTAVQFQRDLLKHQKEEEEYEYLSKLTTFDATTLRLLHHRFNTIDQTIKKDGQISIEEFAKVIKMDCKSILLRRFFKFMDKSEMGSLNFRNFATALSLLSLNAPDEDKIKLSFFLYDINDDQQIDRAECRKMVILALNEINMKLTQKQIDVIVNNTFNQADINNDGVIDYEEYKIYCKKNPRILQPFKIDVARLVQDEQESRRGRRMSTDRKLRHWPGDDTKKKAKIFKKVSKKIPKALKKEKIVRVRSIHNAQEIMGKNNNDSYWKNEAKLAALEEKTGKKHKKNKKKKNKKKNKDKKTSLSLENSNTDDTGTDEDDSDDSDNNDIPLPSKPNNLKLALSADHADRRKKKNKKYSDKQNSKKHKKNKKKKSRHKHHNSAHDAKLENKKLKKKNDDDEKINKPAINISDDPGTIGLNVSQPRTPPPKKEKKEITQAQYESIQRLLM